MKTPKEIAESIREEEREQEAIKNLEKSAKLQIQAKKDLDNEIEKANMAIAEIIKATPAEYQSKVIFIKMKIDKLLNELRNGADVEEIKKKLKALK